MVTDHLTNPSDEARSSTSQDSASNVLAEFTYTLYDNGLRKTEIDRQRNSTATTTFSTTAIAWKYDDLGRLILETHDVGANGPGAGDEADAYGFDLAGNRMYKNVFYDGNTALAVNASSTGYDGRIGYQYDTGGDDQLVKEIATFTGKPIGFTGTTADESYVTIYGHDISGSIAKGYDANGSLLESHRTGSKAADTANFYDLRNRLTQTNTTEAGMTTTTSEGYDSGGDKVSEKVDTVSGTTTTTKTTLYVNDTVNPTGYSQTLEEKPSAGPTRSYILGRSIIAQSDAVTTAELPSKQFFFETDGHGSTRALLDGTGNVASGQIVAYDAYGNVLQSSGNITAATNILYTGQRRVPSTNRYNLRARIYNPATGQFESFDPKENNKADPLSLHKYLYAGADPANMVDPSGHDFSLGELLISAGVDSVLNSILLPRVGGVFSHIATSLVPSSVMQVLSQASSSHVLSAIVAGASFTKNVKGIIGGTGSLSVAASLHRLAGAGYLSGGVSLASGGGGAGYVGVLLNAPDSASFTGQRINISAPVRYWPGFLKDLFLNLPAQMYVSSLTKLSGDLSGLSYDEIASAERTFAMGFTAANLVSKASLTVSFNPSNPTKAPGVFLSVSSGASLGPVQK